MLKIRLQRVGRKNDPSFRVVCVDSRKGPKSGNNVEILGSYSPKQGHTDIKGERVGYWVSKGAHISDTVHNLLVKRGIVKAKKIHVSRGKKNTRDLKVDDVKDETEEKIEKTTNEAEALAKEDIAPPEKSKEEVAP